jgi:hypothetical protein
LEARAATSSYHDTQHGSWILLGKDLADPARCAVGENDRI